MPLTKEEKELLTYATLKPEEYEKLNKMKIRVVYTSFYPAWVLKVLRELRRDFPNRKYRLRYQIVELEEGDDE